MRRSAYFPASLLAAALLFNFPDPVAAQEAEISALRGGEDQEIVSLSGPSRELRDSTFPLDSSLEDPAARFIESRRRSGSSGDATTGSPDNQQTVIVAPVPRSDDQQSSNTIPTGIPDRPFDLQAQDPQVTGTIDAEQAQTSTSTITNTGERPDPYAPLGLRNGNFTYLPQLDISAVYTDNIGQDESNPKPGQGIVLRPSLTVRSNLPRHSASLTLNSEHTIFAKHTDENRHELNITGEARLDVSRSFAIDYEGSYSLTQDSTDGGSSGNTTGTSTNHQGSLSYTFRRRNTVLRPSLRVGANGFLFGDETASGGGTINNSDQDYVEPEVELRIGYGVSRAVEAYAAAEYSRRIHARSRDRNGLKRDSDGYEFRVGADLDFGALVTGNVELGYGLRDSEDSTLGTSHGVVGRSSITWRPTPLTTVQFNSSGSLDETTTAGSSAIQTLSAGVAVSHRLRRNLTATGSVNATFADYLGIRRLDETYEVDVGLSYAFNRHMEFTLRYQHQQRVSPIPGQEYTENQFLAGVQLKM